MLGVSRIPILLTCLVALATTTAAQSDTKFIRETQYSSGENNHLCLIWWIPSEYWVYSASTKDSATQASLRLIAETLEPYVVVAAAYGAMGEFASVSYSTDEDLFANISLRDIHGRTHLPLAPDKVDGEATNFLAMMKPVFAGMIGPLGKNLNFYLWPATVDSLRLADPMAAGSLSVKLFSDSLRVRLPLNALLPEQICSKCGERSEGAWDFCPWCGNKLKKKK